MYQYFWIKYMFGSYITERGDSQIWSWYKFNPNSIDGLNIFKRKGGWGMYIHSFIQFNESGRVLIPIPTHSWPMPDPCLTHPYSLTCRGRCYFSSALWTMYEYCILKKRKLDMSMRIRIRDKILGCNYEYCKY